MGEILVRQSLMSDRKTMRLAKLLGEDRYAAAGCVVALYLWALDNAPDGNLDPDFASYVGDVVGYKGNSEQLMEALTQSRWILNTADFGDDDEDVSLFIADWHEDNTPISRYTETNPNK